MNKYIEDLNNFYKPAKAVFKKEFSSYFFGPVAYIVIVIFLLITGTVFFKDFYISDRADMRLFFQLMPFTFSIFIPALTMKLFAEEKSSGSYEMLMTIPVSPAIVTIAKFTAATAVSVVMIAPTIFYVISASFAGNVDFGPIIGGYLGLILLGATYSSIGLFFSSLTKSQIAAFLSAAAVCFFLTIIGSVLAYTPGRIAGFFQYISTSYHFQNVSKGVIDSVDIVYFISIISLMLILTVKSSEERR